MKDWVEQNNRVPPGKMIELKQDRQYEYCNGKCGSDKDFSTKILQEGITKIEQFLVSDCIVFA